MMTPSGALLWKELRDHRLAVLVFAALVPLVSWPAQRYIFKFAEPQWTWQWLVPICVGLSVAVVAADSFATDIATSRMASLCALPVSLTRHFSVRTGFLAFVALLFTVWTAVVNATIVGVFGKPGTAFEMLFGNLDPTLVGLTAAAAVTFAVLVLSGLGVGGLRGAIGGVLLAALGFAAVQYATDRIAPIPGYQSAVRGRVALEWAITASVLALAAWAGFVASRGSWSRRRGTIVAASILVLAFGAPAGAATWNFYRSWRVSPDDPDVQFANLTVSPDSRYVAVVAQSTSGVAGGSYRSWIVRIDDGHTFTWPGRNDYVAGWTTDGLAWVGRVSSSHTDTGDLGHFADPQTGESRGDAIAGSMSRLGVGGGIGPRWTNWLRWACAPVVPPRPGVRSSSWRLFDKDGTLERTVEACGMPAPLPEVGKVLIVNPEHRLAVVDLAGGEPRVVAEDAIGIQGQLAGSPDGRFHIVQTSKGTVVLEAGTWRVAAGPYTQQSVCWCSGSDTRAVLAVSDESSITVAKLVDVATGREVVIDPVHCVHFGSTYVNALADGRFVARWGTNVELLGADGTLIRRLFPPQE